MVVQALLLQGVKTQLVFFIQKVTNFLQDGHGVRLLFGVLANVDQHIEQFVDIGQVEVAGGHKVPCPPIVLAEERVAIFNLILPKSSIAEVAQKQLPREGVVFLKRHGVPQGRRFEVLEPPHDFLEQILDGARIDGPHTGDVTLARIDVELDVRQPGTVLASVVLFLHQQVHLVEPVKRGAVLLHIVLQRLFEAQHGDATLVLKEIAHSLPKLATGKGGSGATFEPWRVKN